jgi:ribosomal protein S18 acetylase RimI-like enzyme
MSYIQRNSQSMILEYKAERINDIWGLYENSFPQPCPFWQFSEAVGKGITIIEGNDYFTYGFLTSLIDNGEPWIWTIVVHPFHRHYGIGRKLIKEIEKRYTGRMNLFVESNNPAQKLYFDCGYKVIEVVKGIYKDQDALRMVKVL